MKVLFKNALAVAILVLGFSSGVLAQEVQNRVLEPDDDPVATDTDCSVEKKKIATACKADPCANACIKAHKAKKACHKANHILGPTETMDEKKAECNVKNLHSKETAPAGSSYAPER